MIWPILILLVLAAGLPFLAERRKPDVDDALRADAPGKFANLSDGKTHYQWTGPEDGPVLVCIHGLTTPSPVFNALLPGLVAQGFRVLTYDLYGRGYSDRPHGAQTRHFFMRQLRDLLQDQGLAGDLTVMGYSMGGSIATVFAFEEPERVQRLILLAPSGLIHTPGALAEVARRVPGFGDWLMLTLGGWWLRRIVRAQKAHTSVLRDLSARQDSETKLRGYLPGVLSAQRNMLAERLEEEHRALAIDGIPVQAIWGEVDDVIPLQAVGRLTECNRDVSQSVIKGAGHGLAFTHRKEVLEAIAEGLGSS